MLGNFCWASKTAWVEGKFWSFAECGRDDFRDLRGRGGVLGGLHEENPWEIGVFPGDSKGHFNGVLDYFCSGEFVHRAWTPIFRDYGGPHVDVKRSRMWTSRAAA